MTGLRVVNDGDTIIEVETVPAEVRSGDVLLHEGRELLVKYREWHLRTARFTVWQSTYVVTDLGIGGLQQG